MGSHLPSESRPGVVRRHPRDEDADADADAARRLRPRSEPAPSIGGGGIVPPSPSPPSSRSACPVGASHGSSTRRRRRRRRGTAMGPTPLPIPAPSTSMGRTPAPVRRGASLAVCLTLSLSLILLACCSSSPTSKISFAEAAFASSSSPAALLGTALRSPRASSPRDGVVAGSSDPPGGRTTMGIGVPMGRPGGAAATFGKSRQFRTAVVVCANARTKRKKQRGGAAEADGVDFYSNTRDEGEDGDDYGTSPLHRRSSKSSTSSRRTSGVGTASNANANANDPEWQFFDTAKIHVTGGEGGNGCVAFRREKGEAMGGPSGGRGGRGGSIYLRCDSTLNTLAPLRQRVHLRAHKGLNGMGKNRDGSCGSDLVVPVPPGTVVRELHTQRLAGELREDGETFLVARGGRGGRGNAAFLTARRTAPKLAERGEPGAARWLSVELRLVADVGFLGKPNAGKSTLLAAASAARPKIADYPFTTIVPNLGVCDLGDEGAGLVLCDIPGLIEGAADGAGMGPAFLRHVQRCRVLLHVMDGTSEDPVGDFVAINEELEKYDEYLAQKPQVVVLNKMDVPEVRERSGEIMAGLREAAGHTRVLSISAATTERVKELMGRLKKFVKVQPEPELPPPPEIDFSTAGLEHDSDDYEIISDPAYPGQFRVRGAYIEGVAKMTHWEYPEAVERFGRQLEALGIAHSLRRRGATDGDLVMVDEYDFDFNPGASKNPYVPAELLERDMAREAELELRRLEEDASSSSSVQGGASVSGGGDGPGGKKHYDAYYVEDEDVEELMGFNEEGDWDLLDDDGGDNDLSYPTFDDDEIWTS